MNVRTVGKSGWHMFCYQGWEEVTGTRTDPRQKLASGQLPGAIRGVDQTSGIQWKVIEEDNRHNFKWTPRPFPEGVRNQNAPAAEHLGRKDDQFLGHPVHCQGGIWEEMKGTRGCWKEQTVEACSQRPMESTMKRNRKAQKRSCLRKIINLPNRKN